MAIESFRPNTIKINSIILENYAGDKRQDISELMITLDIFESIYTNTITGTITIKDSNELIQFFPIIGREYISIDAILPGLEENKNWTLSHFRVYKVSDRVLNSDKVQTYTLWFTSEETIVNSNIRVTKSWNNSTVDKIVKDIFSNDLKSKKKLKVSNTIIPQVYIAPSWYPFKVINYLAKSRAINSNNLADFMFFESISEDGKETVFNFVSLSELTKQEPIAKFTYQPLNMAGGDLYKITNVESITFQKDIDYLDLKLKGLYNQTNVYYDPIRKRTVTEKIDYKDIYEKTSDFKMGSWTPVVDEEFTTGTTNIFMVNEFPLMISSNKGINNIKNKTSEAKPRRSDDQYIKENNIYENSLMTEKVFAKRSVLMAEFDMFKVNLNGVSGNYLLYSVGRTVNFEKPHIVNDRDKTASNTNSNEDKLLSGKYLITRNRHRIVKEKGNFEYKNYIEISKNSFN